MVWAGPQLACQPHRAGHVDAAGAARGTALSSWIRSKTIGNSLVIGDLVREVRREPFQIGRDPAPARCLR